jgi:hypothetical protein
MKELTGWPAYVLVDTAASTFADNSRSYAGNDRSDSVKVNFKKI